MRHFISIILIFTLFFSAASICSLPAYSTAAPGTDAESIARLTDELFNNCLASAGVSSLQVLLDGELAAGATNGSEWYVLALTGYAPSLDYTYYANMLEYNLSRNAPSGAVARLRCALTLIACGRDTCDFVTRTASDSIGEMGIMSYIFGLHLLNNGVTSPVYTREQIIDILLSMQCADGGWSLGNNSSDGDVDVTSMVIQSLALSYNLNATVRAAIECGIAFLSGAQLADGGFIAYGSPNPESSAQVIIALTSIGIDPTTDSRFIKNGKSPLDAMLAYRLNEGGFSHALHDTANNASTSQALCALVALKKFISGGDGFYIFSGDVCSDSPGHEAVSNATDTSAVVGIDTQNTPNVGEYGYKLTVCIVLIVVLLFILLVLYLRGRFNRKNVVFSILICIVAVIAVLVTDIRSPGDYYSSEIPEKSAVVGTVTLTIRCDSVVGLSETSHIPSDGIILDKTVLAISKDESVYDILIEAARKHGIHIEYNGSALGGRYISAIGNIYEHDFGDLSGWIYTVNGTSPSVGCDAFLMTDGDNIEWFYTRDIVQGGAASALTGLGGGYQ